MANTKTPVESHLVILKNLKTVLSRTRFAPEEFQAAADMGAFIDALEMQAMGKAKQERAGRRRRKGSSGAV